MRLLRAALAISLSLTGFLAVPATYAADEWGELAVISSTLGVNANRLCLGESTRGEIGCPTYAPTVNSAGLLTANALSATYVYGQYASFTTITAGSIVGLQSDRITSGTHSVIANTATGYISLSTGGTDWGYLGSTANYLPSLNVGSRIGIGTTTPSATTALDVSGTARLARLYVDSYADNANATITLTGHNAGVSRSANIGTNFYGSLSLMPATSYPVVGIRNNSSVGANLQVTGNQAIGFGNNQSAPTDGLAVNGYVGIANAAPSATLHVSGSIRIAEDTSASTSTCDADRTGAIRYRAASSQFQVCYGSGGWATLAAAATSGTDAVVDRITSGTTNVTAKQNNSVAYNFDNAEHILISSASVYVSNSTISPRLVLDAVSSVNTDITPSIYFRGGTSLGANIMYTWGVRFSDTAGYNNMTVSHTTSGIARTRVGIGNGPVGAYITPQTTLDVSGTLRIANGDFTCDANRTGAIRYHAANSQFQVCYGSGGWATLSAAATSGTLDVSVSINDLTDATKDANNNLWLGTEMTPVSNSNNTAVGVGALDSMTNHSAVGNNTAVGYLVLTSATTGRYNSGVGSLALSNNTTGNFNAAFGYSALGVNTTGSSNLAIGTSSLLYNTTGQNNIAIGTQALQSSQAGTGQTAIGGNSMLNISGTTANPATSNTAIGYGALTGSINPVNNTGDSNLAIGMYSLAGLSSGDFNTVLGNYAGDSVTTGSSNILLGYDVDTPAATSSNFLNIGNAISGTMLPGIGSSLTFIGGAKFNGAVTATYFEGDGSHLTNISTSIRALSDTSATAPVTGQLLQYNAAISKWVATSPSALLSGSQVVFQVNRNNVNQTVSSGADTPVDWTTKTIDTNNNFDTSTDRFTPTVPGYYLLVAALDCIGNTAYCQVIIRKNGTGIASDFDNSNSSVSTQASFITYMNGSTDYVTVSGINGGGTSFYGHTYLTNFQGALINGYGAGGSGGATALSGLSDVALSGLAPGEVLTYNGSAWVNSSGSSGDRITSGTTSVIAYNNGVVSVSTPRGYSSFGHGNYVGQYTVLNTTDTTNSALGVSAEVSQSLTANGTNYGIGLSGHTIATTLSPLANNGYVMGVNGSAFNQGTGNLASAIGLRAQAGNFTGGTGTTNNAYGVYVQSVMSGGTIANSYGVYITDVLGTNQYSLYQVGANDTNYLAGKLGIGTTAPTSLLQISGTTATNFRLNSTADGGFYIRSRNAENGTLSAGAEFVSNSWVARTSNVALLALNDGAVSIFNNTGLTPGNAYTPTETFTYTSASHLGLGTRAPTAKLTISTNNASTFPAPTNLSNTNQYLLHLGATDGSNTAMAIDGFGAGGMILGRRANGTAAAPSALLAQDAIFALRIAGRGATGYAASSNGNLVFHASENWTDTANGMYARLTLTPNGSTTAQEVASFYPLGIGIGTISPTNTLDLGTGTNGRGIAWGGGAGTGNYTNIYSAYSSAALVMASGLRGGTAADNYYSSYDGSIGRAAIRMDPFTGGSEGTIQFFTNPASAVNSNTTYTPTERMRITSLGRVGIGTNNPATSLTVVGEVQVSNSGVACNSSTQGAIRYNGGSLYFCNGTTFTQLASGGGATSIDGLTDATKSNANMWLGSEMSALSNNQYNTAVGYGALNALTDSAGPNEGDNNTALGYDALGNTTTGSYNIGVGLSALYTNTSGNRNIAVGSNVLYYNETGSGNIAFGHNALQTNVSGDNNLALGTQSGYATTGTSNTFIGAYAGINNTTGSNNIAIGAGADVPTATASNQLNIGNTIYGNLSTGRVGIGTTTPSGTLDVSGTLFLGNGTTAMGGHGRLNFVNVLEPKIQLWHAGASSMYGFGMSSNQLNYQIDSSVAAHVFLMGGTNNGGTELMRILGTRQVGIGTSSPAASLTVVGEVQVSNSGLACSTAAQGAIRYTANKLYFCDGTNFTELTTAASTPATDRITSGTTTAIAYQDGSLTLNTAGSTRVFVGANGHVGIGYSGPNELLHLYASAQTTPTMRVQNVYDGADTFIRFTGRNTGGALHHADIGTVDGGHMVLRTPYNAERMRLTTTGLLGLGTNSPTAVLDLGFGTSGRGIAWGGNNGTSNYTNIWAPYSASGLVLATGLRGGTAADNYYSSYDSSMARAAIRLNLGGTNPGVIQFFTDGASAVNSNTTYTPTERMRITTTGRVGIGTDNPSATLHLVGPTSGVVLNSYTSSSTFAEYRIADETGLSKWSMGAFGDNNSNPTSRNGFYVYRYTNASDTTVNSYAMLINDSGNVGIGTTLPSTNLDVSGSIAYTGIITDLSDRRLKTDIKPLEADSLALINKLQPVSFRMKNNLAQMERGFIAQDVQGIFPDLVTTANDASATLSMNYTGLIAPLTKAVQQLAQQNDQLKADNAAMRKEIDDIKRLLGAQPAGNLSGGGGR